MLWRVRVILLFLLASAFGSFGQTQPRILNSTKEVLELSADDQKKQIAVKLRGVVTCSEGPWYLCFLQDATAGIYLQGMRPYPEVGDLVELTGRATEGLFAPIVQVDKSSVVGKTNLPPARTVSIEQVLSGRFDADWVEVEGVVLTQKVEGSHLVLLLGSGKSMLSVRVLHFDERKKANWVDARVKVRGVAATSANQNRQITGFEVFSQTADMVTVLTPPPVDPFVEPLRTSRNLLAYSRTGDSEHRVHIRGVVTFFWPGRDFFVRDEAGSVRIQAVQTEPLNAGDMVDVVGFRTDSEIGPTLWEALYKKVGTGAEPKPRTVQIVELMKGNLEGEIVSIDGTVLHVTEASGGFSTLILGTDQGTCRVCFQRDWKFKGGKIEPGYHVRATGVCALNPPKVGGSGIFSIWMRRPEDFAVVMIPSVWNHTQTIYLVSGVVGALGLAGTWMVMLRIRVRRRTEEIRKSELSLEERFRDLYQNANDIIYTHDLGGRITSMNNAGTVLFGYHSEAEMLQLSISDLVDAEELEKAKKSIQAKLDGKLRTTYELKLRSRNRDRVYLDINSRLIYKDGAPIGVQGIGRNITERKRAEEALRVSERQLRASLEERERLGRDLHDGIIQSLYATGLNLENSLHVTRGNGDSMEKRVKEITHDLNRIIREVRGFIMGLEQNRLKGDEFKGALKSLALMAGESQGAMVELLIDESTATKLSSIEATQLLQIAREALSNSIRHAKANKFVFELRPSDHGGARFELIDDGVGFNPVTNRDKGLGLRNMAARAEEIGAAFQIVSQMGEGTRIVLDMRRSAEKVGV